MAVFRVERTRDYTVMCNHHLKDSNLSLKAKGLLSMMLSLPDEWNYTTRGLAAICASFLSRTVPAFTDVTFSSTKVFHSLHAGHCPSHLLSSCPQFWQKNTLFFAFAIIHLLTIAIAYAERRAAICSPSDFILIFCYFFTTFTSTD